MNVLGITKDGMSNPLVGRGIGLLVALSTGVGVAVLPPAWLLVVGVGGVLGLAIVHEPVLVVILMLAVAPLKALIATEAGPAFPFDVGQIGFALAVAVWVGWHVTTNRAFVWRGGMWLAAGMGLLLGVFALTILKAASVGAWATEWLKWVEIFFLVWIAADFARSRRWQWLVFGVVWSAVIQAAVGLYEYRGGSGAEHLWIDGFRHFRAFGTFGQPNPFSALMGLTIPLSLGMAWGYTVRAWGIWRRRDARAVFAPLALAAMWAGFALICLAGLVVSWGRGAWIGFGAAFILMVLLAPRRRWVGGLLLSGLLLAFLALWWLGAMPISVQVRLTSAYTEFSGFGDVRGAPVNNANFATIERLAHWQAAYAMASANPLLGVGLGNYEVVYPSFALPRWPQALGHAHNDYLNVLAETGFLGFIAYVGLWGLIMVRTLMALQTPEPVARGAILGLAGTWTHLSVHSVVDKLYVNNLFLHIGVMLGVLVYLESRRHSRSPEYGYDGDI